MPGLDLKLFTSRKELYPLLFSSGSSSALTAFSAANCRQALLDFADAVPHRRKLSWNPATPVCTSWVGITCTPNGTRVTSLRLPGVGLVGSVPPTPSRLYLQRNNFSGDIPTSFSPQLNVLDLSFNSFTGNIPQTMRNLTQLTELSLQNNTLTGPIPDLDLPKLKRLNLSYNRLNGSIPSSLQRFPNSSFVRNSLLCGGPLKPCSLKKDNGGTSVLKGKSSTGGRSEKPKEEFGSGVQEPEKNKLVFFEGCSYNFDLDDLLRASAEVLGKGSYGTAYNGGYRAPEVIETRRHSHKSDVYSFGVVLLEMLTGKAPLRSPGRDDMVDLPRWVQSVVREEWTAEVFDVELMRYQNIEEEMVQMLQIAMAYVAKEEVKRIQSVPLVIGQFMEMVDQNNEIVGSTTGSNYYVRILSTINREHLKPSASVAFFKNRT
ncbi:hypothetical protein C1H46_018924 [Malus baccata]|uniref:Protein kinase domain-containing protein n=1 Tax=Malus baccata TaxID=106549 RepID=A0A540MAD7_MALBA|nr:hypothetical protein C1H46_018924 [Malus baccata]